LEPDARIRNAWNACRPWVDVRDGQSSELFVLDVPEDSIERLFEAVRDRARIVAVLGRDGMESFAGYQWMDSDDDDLIMSTFFIAVLCTSRLQHFLAPSRPRAPGPWVSVSRGPMDLEIAFWPDEIFPEGASPGLRERTFAALLGYVLGLREAAGGSAVVVTHGCDEDPRRLVTRGGGRAYVAFGD
jgi:hypothetical protein